MTGFDAFMNNPSWKAIYDNAPTGLLKEYYKLKFNTHPDFWDVPDDVDDSKLQELKSQFTNIEWQYLLDNTDNIVAKMYYSRMLKKV